jgi:hypothetical protein
LIDYRRFNKWLELQAIGGTGLLYFKQVIANGEDDGLERRGTGAIPPHVSLVEKLKKSQANQFTKQGELVRVVSVKGGPIQRSSLSDVLDRYIVETFLFQ